ncbi:nitrate- and nitrite sensing domain-containing protein [Streptomyces sp. Amel2xB2]|uniref:sensor histidine kinase n=1 Tax=Streptomyces sp. Amel2xB2 TaxID=1305829 RepID=UPI0015EC56A9|nr:nitrate- and nitrite sensing domain-containing protein [Streptomyces sp. Amel2xB2]
MLCSLAVLGAGTPTVLGAYGDLNESQDLVERAELDKQAIALSHALADERDGMVEYVAAGRTSRNGAGVTEEQRARVDRQVSEIRETAPVSVRKSLGRLSGIRQEAQAGDGNALEMYEAYTATINSLQDVGTSLARSLPERATETSGSEAGSGSAGASGTNSVSASGSVPGTSGPSGSGAAYALPDLGSAVQQASAVRGLLRGALAAGGPQPTLTSEAQRASVREQAALADFGDSAPGSARDTFARTVTGADVRTAERYLAKLTDQPYLSARDRAMNHERIDAALSARIDSMRGVQSSFAAEELKHFERLRDSDVTTLEWYIALVGVCLLLAAGISVQTARSMARPLSVLTRGSRRLAADPTGEEPVVFNGRNDEFAEVVRSLNSLREAVVSVHERAAEAEADNAYLVRHKDGLTAERDRVRGEYAALKKRVDALSGAVHGTFVNLAMRTLGLVERQLGVIEDLEERESDPNRLSTLFKLDHLATRMRRYSENLLLLAGAEHVTASHAGPVPLLDVVRAAISEIERYERVELGTLPPHAQVAGHAADDLSHLVSELLDNATSFSPPDSQVHFSGWLLESGEVMLSVEDEGIGVSGRRLAALNARLSLPEGQDPPVVDAPAPSASGTSSAASSAGSSAVSSAASSAVGGERGPEEGLGMGLYVVARLAARHGLRVQLRERRGGAGITAIVAVPAALLPSRPAPVAAGTAGGAGDVGAGPAGAPASFPGSVAEANSNALPARRTEDPLVSAAEQAVRDARGASEEHGRAPGGSPDAAGSRAGEATGERTGVRPEPRPAHGPPAGTVPKPSSGSAAAAPVTGAASADAAGSGDHGQVPGAGADFGPDSAPGPDSDADSGSDSGPAIPEQPRLTDKGLPKRTPHHVEPRTGGPDKPRNHSANADEMRRRLGGFQRGAEHGRRDAAAETGADERETGQRGTQSDGGTAEEART